PRMKDSPEIKAIKPLIIPPPIFESESGSLMFSVNSDFWRMTGCAIVCAMNAHMIEPKLMEVLADREKSMCWLAQETGIAYTTLHRLGKAKANSIDFGNLRRLKLQAG